MKSHEMTAAMVTGLAVSISVLANCLKANGSLREGQFEAALRATIGHPDAEVHRLDYKVMQNLLDLLEDKGRPLH